MKTYDYGKVLTNKEYHQIQIKRSKQKYQFCRVSIFDAIFTMKVLQNFGYKNGAIACMGTRNGREVDLFRIAASNNDIWKKLAFFFESDKYCYSSRLPFIESIRRSNVGNIREDSVVGVELNPDARRKDILIGSFDELPREWENKFTAVYSNSFDQAIDPEKTAREWIRVIKSNGLLIFHYKEQDKTTYTDPTGDLTIKEIESLFQGEILLNSKTNFDLHNPDCVILRIKK